VRAILRNGIDKLTRRVARSYIVGPELSDAVRAAKFIAPQDMVSTICYWDSETDNPRDIANRYRSIIESISNEHLNCYVSIRPWALQFSYGLFDELCAFAHQHDVSLHLDSLLPDASDKAFAMIERDGAQGPTVGCTLPGRWQRSVSDAGRAIDLGLRVRIVKGQWPEPQGADLNPREGFLKVVDRLSGYASAVAVATHDVDLARESLKRLRSAGTSCELELLFGLPVGPGIGVARSLGIPVRIYLPFGKAWLPYVIAQAKRNPVIAWWLFRDLWLDLRSRALGAKPTHLRLRR
jgi:proline dehydrogenase